MTAVLDTSVETCSNDTADDKAITICFDSPRRMSTREYIVTGDRMTL